MGQIEMAGSGGGGVTSDDVTVVKAHVLKGERTITADSNDEITEGEMTVNSLLSFSVAAYSGRRMLASWKNPKQAAGRPYSGVIIEYATGTYPAKGKGTRIYKGVGNNILPEGESSVWMDLPNLDTVYYFTAYAYVVTNIGDMTGEMINLTAKTSAENLIEIKNSQKYTIPVGFTKMDLFAVGGGGGTTNKSTGKDSSGGAGSGYTKTVTNISISSGQVLNIEVGTGGEISEYSGVDKQAGSSKVSSNGTVLIEAEGGHNAGPSYTGSTGGSGGGDGAVDTEFDYTHEQGKKGGSDGGGGWRGSDSSQYQHNNGQGRTTRAFGKSNGTIYAGGGGGGGLHNGKGGAGGAGGGGKGGDGKGFNSSGNPGANGTNNTGGGAGGCCGARTNGTHLEAKGGTGIVIIRLY